MFKDYQTINKIKDSITVIEELPETAAEHFQVEPNKIYTIYNDLLIQKSIEEFKFFYNHNI